MSNAGRADQGHVVRVHAENDVRQAVCLGAFAAGPDKHPGHRSDQTDDAPDWKAASLRNKQAVDTDRAEAPAIASLSFDIAKRSP